MISQEEKLSADDLMFLRVAIIMALGNPDIKNMPKARSALDKLSYNGELVIASK